ncbi:MAG: FAD-dependent oxidoreductase [Candidatus Eisenbacteria bacterium]|nr:FAD-dependent oxidoreductase [Candidatus Eisenbacteria bacterium]
MQTRYCIVGGGYAAAAAIEGIRAHDRDGSIVLLTRENHRPYRRPLLSKDLWYGTATIERLPMHPDEWYDEHKVEVRLRHEVIEVDADHRRLFDERGDEIEYGDLLLATGCRPRRLRAEGAETPGVGYFRDLEDYLALEGRMDRLQHITLVGGGFTSIEMAAALRSRGKEITLVIADEYPLHRMLPRDLGLPLLDFLRDLGIETVSGDVLAKVEETVGMVHARTYLGNELDTQLILVDQGGEPLVDLAEAAGIAIDDGIVVNEFGRTSDPHVWAAGDVAEFPYQALGQIMRIEGADHAEAHGRVVGANMAGAKLSYDHIPLKWFRVGEMQFEGVGELWARLDTELLWIEPGREGAVFYLRDEVIRGVLLINVHERIEWARGLIREAKPTTSAERANMLGVKA